MSIGLKIRSTAPVVLFCGCLSTTTPHELSDKLYATIGLEVPEENISIIADAARANYSALILLDREILAPFLEMCLKSVGETIRVKPAISKTEKRVQRETKLMDRSNVSSTIVESMVGR
jgi:hypothetical protein